MRIKTKFIITMLLFGIILVVMAVSTIITSGRVDRAMEQEKTAGNIAQGANELGYLANDYLIYREDQQLKRWQNRFASFSGQVARLNVDRPEEQALVRNIQANQKRLKEVFDSTASAFGDSSSNVRVALDPAFLQVSWSRLAVQSQTLISDATRLSQLLHQETDRLVEIRAMLMYVMVSLFGVFLIASYMLIYRRVLKSIAMLQAGAAVIGAGNLDLVIEESEKDELGDLARDFNRMTKNLKNVTASKADLEREVAERAKAEIALRASEQRWATTLASIGDAVIATEVSGRITFMNGIAEGLTGWQLNEASRRPVAEVFKIINEQTRQKVESPIEKVLEMGNIVGLANHTVLLRKDGTEFPIDDSGAPIRDPNGKVTGVVLVFRDITERKRAEEQLALLASFPRLNPNPIVEVDLSSTPHYLNSAAEKLLPDLRTAGPLHPWLADLESAVDQLRKQSESIIREVRIGDRWYQQTMHYAEENQRVRIYGLDITERKRSEAERERSNQQRQLALDAARMGWWHYDPITRVASWDDRYKEIFGVPGYTRPNDEILAQIIHPEDLPGLWARVEAALDPIAPQAFAAEYRINRPDGALRWIEAHGVASFEGDGADRRATSLAGTVSDITERKRAEEALIKAHEELEARVQERTADLARANKELQEEIARREKAEQQLLQAQKLESIGTLTGGIAHDFNNILGAIVINSEMALLDLPAGSGVRSNLALILKSGERGRDLVRQMLLFSRKSEKKQEILTLTPLIKETFRLLRSSVPTTIQMKLQLETESDAVHADPSQIQQVIMNLCTNASYAMRGTTGSINISLQSVTFGSTDLPEADMQPGDYLVLVVRDTGSGMDAEVRKRVFEPFFTTKPVGEGTGLGLSVAYGIVKSHRGNITVYSEPGRGSVFRVYLPKADTRVSEKAGPPKPILGGNERILFVDDEEIIVQSVRNMLVRLGYKVTTVTDSEDALKLFSEKPSEFDLVMTDQTMPAMTGEDLGKELMRIRPDIPVILCTGYSDLISSEKALAMGFRGFIMKPFTLRESAELVRRVLDEKKK